MITNTRYCERMKALVVGSMLLREHDALTNRIILCNDVARPLREFAFRSIMYMLYSIGEIEIIKYRNPSQTAGVSCLKIVAVPRVH
jgi:hypothetical protein